MLCRSIAVRQQYSGIALQCLENVQLFLFDAKVVLIFVAAVLPALWLGMMPNPSYGTSQDTDAGFVYIFFNEIFCPEHDIEID